MNPAQSPPTTSEKLTIMETGGAISERTKTTTLKTIASLNSEVPCDYDNGVGQMMVVHLAMAIERSLSDDPGNLQPADSQPSKQAETAATRLLNTLRTDHGITLDASEAGYLGVYFDALTQSAATQ